jgi:hypothetical protein
MPPVESTVTAISLALYNLYEINPLWIYIFIY